MTTPQPSPYEVNLDASYDFDSDINADFYSDLDVFSDWTADHDLNVDVDIDGNDATFAVDLQAFGENTSTELNLLVAVEEDAWSSITASGYAAAGTKEDDNGNTPPTTVNDVAYVELGDAVTANVAGNDLDGDGTIDPASLQIVTPPLFGTAVANPDGTISYSDNIADAAGDDSVTDTVGYQIADNEGATANGSLGVNVIDPLVETSTDTDTGSNGQPLSMTLSTEDRTANTTSFAEVDIQVGDLQDSDVNVAFVYDSSGSVPISAYNEQIEAIQNAIDQLRTDYASATNSVTVNLIRFSTGAAESGAIDLFDPSLDDISALPITAYINGSTNYAAPLQLAVNFINAQDPGGTEDNFVLFASDGAPNTGGDHTAIATTLKGLASVSAVGFGSGINTTVLDTVDNTGGSEVVATADQLGDVFGNSPLFNAQLVSFDLTLSVDGGAATQVADETDLQSLGGGDYTLDLASVAGLIGSDASTNVFNATSVFDTDGDLTTTADQVTLVATTTVEGAVPDAFWI